MVKALPVALWAAAAAAAQLAPVPRFPIRPDPLTIVQPAQFAKPFTVAGEYGAIFGDHSGAFEAWQFPVKILSRFSITAELDDYPVPIELAEHAAAIEVAPAMTTITYSHAAFTVKQRMFAPRDGPPLVLFEIASARPLRLTFRFKPDMLRMWPAPSFGTPSAEWVKDGYYILHTDDPSLTAAVAMPRAQPGVLPPSQERPKTYPVEFKLRFDPRTDSNLLFPLLFALGDGNRLAGLNARIPASYAAAENYYAHFFDTRLTAETPDAQFNLALRWAEIAIDQCRVRFHGETGLVAGFYSSGDSARPGFGWFFGRDTLWTTYALNGYGDFALTRDSLEFLVRRQRDDGKIMHEFSQTADLVDWKATPYFFAAADSTPLFVMAMEDYLATSGDAAFVRKHWDAVRRAYAFTRAHDSDGDGIYENTEGTGWVESWPPGMPHQEIYLAALDQQSADSMSRLAAAMNEPALAAAARDQARHIREALEKEYYEPGRRFYAFSRNPDGTLDSTATIYPAVTWWTGRLALPLAGPMLSRWASSEFSTAWGTRDLSIKTPFYDPISYHQGSVWPLFTGWVSLAEYRTGRPLSGYAHLMQNAGLTWTQDAGSVTELLSGQFFQPLGRSSSHQLWSSAMVLVPALRGLFGLEGDRPRQPHLPAHWDSARLRNVPLGGKRLDLQYVRNGDQLIVSASDGRRFQFPLPPVELSLPHGLPLPGSETADLKAVEERATPNGYTAELEAPSGTVVDLPVRFNRTGVRVAGGTLREGKLRVKFPAGTGYQRHEISFSW